MRNNFLKLSNTFKFHVVRLCLKDSAWYKTIIGFQKHLFVMILSLFCKTSYYIGSCAASCSPNRDNTSQQHGNCYQRNFQCWNELGRKDARSQD